MQFIELSVKTATIIHEYDHMNHEVSENINEPEFTTKLIAISRILSISEQYLLVTGSHGRVMYWEYDMDFVTLKQKLQGKGLIV
jgi:hypothetical protein